MVFIHETGVRFPLGLQNILIGSVLIDFLFLRINYIMIKQLFVGIFFFIILNFIAMFLYPGGTINDSTTEGYLFFYNFFSNLGDWTALNGMDNFYSALSFNVSMLILVLSYTLFYMSYYKFFLDEKRSKIFIRISFVFVMVSMICFVLIAIFSSENATFQLHVFFVKIAGRSFMLYSIFQSLAVVYNSKSSNKMIFSNLFFTIILFFFIFIMEFGPNPFKDNESLFIQVISQKIIVFSILIYFYTQVREVLKIPSNLSND